jgi:CRP-like cAMP-binding protein
MKSINFLKDMLLFQGLEEEEIANFIGIARETFFPQGKVVIRENEIGDTMYIILEGTVEVSKGLTLKLGKSSFREDEKILTRLSADDHVVFVR